MQTDGKIIYVAGNPDLYPMEYYDAESQTYQGAIPDFLAAFAQEYGYDLRYFQPGTEDRRGELAENQQVDLISGCEAGERYSYTDGDALCLFPSQSGGRETTYALFLTRVSPKQFQTDLREYAAQASQAEWIGAILESVEETQQQNHPGVLWGAGAAILLLMACLLVLLRLRRGKKAAPQSRRDDGLDAFETLKEMFTVAAASPSRSDYSLICIHLNLDRLGQLWGYERARELFLHGATILRKELGDEGILTNCGEDLLVLRRTAEPEGTVQWADGAVQHIRDASAVGRYAQDVAAGIYPLAVSSHDFEHALFHVRQCARDACREEQSSRLCGSELCRFCQERWNLLDDFFHALERDEFQLYIQFFVDAESFRVVGGEALSRWYHPKLGLLNPDRYVPLLEETGQIEALDFYGLEKVCAFLDELGKHKVQDFFLSCNFARKTISAPDFVQRCTQVAQRYTFPRKLLILEVTESQQMNHPEMEQICQNIREIREYGIRVIFDDFGVGFSSFHDLQNCPMDGLKLDKALVDNMHTEKGRIILNALVEAGHRMELTILAEGVEEDAQIATLRQLHCDAFQGFRFAVPLPELEGRKRILQGKRSLKDRDDTHEENCHAE